MLDPLLATAHSPSILPPLPPPTHPPHAEPGTRNLSRSLEDSLTWHLVLLGSCLGGLRPQHAAPLVTTVEGLVDDTLQVRVFVGGGGRRRAL
jgi:hypothetical protein